MAKATQTVRTIKWTLELSDEEAMCLRGMVGGASGSDFKSMGGSCDPRYSRYVNRTYAMNVKNALDAAGI